VTLLAIDAENLLVDGHGPKLTYVYVSPDHSPVDLP